jgi:hypothetical protein
MQQGGAVAIEHTLRVVGRAARVAPGGGAVLVEAGPDMVVIPRVQPPALLPIRLISREPSCNDQEGRADFDEEGGLSCRCHVLQQCFATRLCKALFMLPRYLGCMTIIDALAAALLVALPLGVMGLRARRDEA